MKSLKVIIDGIFRRNPTFVLVLGLCPTLGTTSSAITGMSMGLATLIVLMCSNFTVSALKSIIPDKVRIPAFILLIASFVTIVQMIMQAWLPALNESLGIFIPLIVVNCILLGRAEAFASKNNPWLSVCDGLGIGSGNRLPRSRRRRQFLRRRAIGHSSALLCRHCDREHGVLSQSRRLHTVYSHRKSP